MCIFFNYVKVVYVHIKVKVLLLGFIIDNHLGYCLFVFVYVCVVCNFSMTLGVESLNFNDILQLDSPTFRSF
jgi:hypothetical protein